MIGFHRDGDQIVARLDEHEAEALMMVIAQVAGLIEQVDGSDPVDFEPIDDTLGDSSDDSSDGSSDDESDPRLDDPDAEEILVSLWAPDVPDDPALARLFPDGYRDDPEASAELRGLIQDDLRATKLANIGTVLGSLSTVATSSTSSISSTSDRTIQLDEEQAEAWMLALNDARLVLGTRLDLQDDTDILAEFDAAIGRDPAGPTVFAISMYQFLSLLQDSLVGALVNKRPHK